MCTFVCFQYCGPRGLFINSEQEYKEDPTGGIMVARLEVGASHLPHNQKKWHVVYYIQVVQRQEHIHKIQYKTKLHPESKI